MGRRREQRIAINLPIIVRGQDALGNPFRQSARTLDISRTGARIDGVFCLPGSGVSIEIEFKGQKASYSVKWIGAAGTPQAGQIGLRSLSPDTHIWREQLPASGPDPYSVTRPAQSAAQNRILHFTLPLLRLPRFRLVRSAAATVASSAASPGRSRRLMARQ